MWEYTTIQIMGTPDSNDGVLNQYGQQGWELVNMWMRGECTYATFKRVTHGIAWPSGTTITMPSVFPPYYSGAPLQPGTTTGKNGGQLINEDIKPEQ